MPQKRDPIGAADRSSRSDWKAAQRRREQEKKPEADLGPVLGRGDRCWCGEKYGHFWKGNDLTQIHPPVDKGTST